VLDLLVGGGGGGGGGDLSGDLLQLDDLGLGLKLGLDAGEESLFLAVAGGEAGAGEVGFAVVLFPLGDVLGFVAGVLVVLGVEGVGPAGDELPAACATGLCRLGHLVASLRSLVGVSDQLERSYRRLERLSSILENWPGALENLSGETAAPPRGRP
jgi:hypothetical protein